MTRTSDLATTPDVIRLLQYLQREEGVTTIDEAVEYLTTYGVDWDESRSQEQDENSHYKLMQEYTRMAAQGPGDMPWDQYKARMQTLEKKLGIID